MEDVKTALVPIGEALPELRAEQYAKVREWDAARMALVGEYEAADGEYLKLIRDTLKRTAHGLWTRYLEARGIPDSTARRRIQVAEGRFVRPKPLPYSGLHKPEALPQPVPAPTSPAVETIFVPRDELRRLEQIEQAWEQQQIMPAPVPAFTRPLPPTPPAPLDEYVDEPEPEELPAPTPQEITASIAHYRTQTREAQSEPFADFLLRTSRCLPVADDAVAAWLDVSPRDHWDTGIDMLARLRAFVERAEQIINDRKRGSLRVVR